jgi:hypothetical protein
MADALNASSEKSRAETRDEQSTNAVSHDHSRSNFLFGKHAQRNQMRREFTFVLPDAEFHGTKKLFSLVLVCAEKQYSLFQPGLLYLRA